MVANSVMAQAVKLPSRMTMADLRRGISKSVAMALPVQQPVPGSGSATKMYRPSSSMVSWETLPWSQPRMPLLFFACIFSRLRALRFSSHAANLRTGLMGRV